MANLNQMSRGPISAGSLAVGGQSSITKVGGAVKCTLVAGQDETGDDTIPVTGMAVGDTVIAVLVFTTAAAIASVTKKADADVTAIADNVQVTGNKANNTNNQYVILWADNT